MATLTTLDHHISQTLRDVQAGDVCRVNGVSLEADVSARLAGLGVSAGRQMRVIRNSEPVVVQVYGARIGIARAIADRIHISTEPQPAGAV